VHIPKQFEEANITVLHQLIRVHPLGALVTLSSAGLDANHIPWVLDQNPAPFGTLRGHVARANPMWRDHETKVGALVVFQGAEQFISPSWYPTKQETGKVVPTWNYVVVHAHGPIAVMDESEWVRRHLEELTGDHERGRHRPWTLADAPVDYVSHQINAIVGLEIRIARLVGKWKVSQNRPPQDRAGVVEGLRREGTAQAEAMAEVVRERDPH